MAELTYLPDQIAQWVMRRPHQSAHRLDIRSQYQLDPRKWDYVISVYMASPRYEMSYRNGVLIMTSFTPRPLQCTRRPITPTPCRNKGGRPVSVTATHLDTGIETVFPSLALAEQEGFSRCSINLALRRDPPIYSGYRWRRS